MVRCGWMAWVLVLLTGCGTSAEAVRMETGRGPPRVFSSRAPADSVTLAPDDFKAAVAARAHDVRPSAHPLQDARKLFGVPPRSGSYLYEPRSRRLVPLEPDSLLEHPVDAELTRAYLRWCERTLRAGDCLRLLVNGSLLDSDGKYTMAMAIAQGAVLGEAQQAFRDMADPAAVVATLVSAGTMYFMLWVLPEPVSKGLAVAVTVGLMGYLGFQTVWGLIDGWMQLVMEVDRASTFEEVRSAGERFGALMGRNAARIFTLLATTALGNAAGLSAQLPSLPGATQAAAIVEAQTGLVYSAAAGVQSVAVTAESFSIALAPGATAMAARGVSGGASGNAPPSGFRAWKSSSGFRKAMGSAGAGKEWHHVVEQTPGNVERFGAETLHNTNNVIPLDKALHTRVSAFYSSKNWRLTGSTMLTVRQWLSSQSFEAQRKFGLLVIENIQKGIW